jgi:hypothetical protein
MILKSDSISAVHTDQCDSAAGVGIGNINAATSDRPSRCRACGGFPLPDKQWNESISGAGRCWRAGDRRLGRHCDPCGGIPQQVSGFGSCLEGTGRGCARATGSEQGTPSSRASNTRLAIGWRRNGMRVSRQVFVYDARCRATVARQSKPSWARRTRQPRSSPARRARGSCSPRPTPYGSAGAQNPDRSSASADACACR